MKRVEVEVFSDDTNQWIVRSPGRQLPALVVQGDSFSILRGLARDVAKLAAVHENAELSDAADELLGKLESRLAHYEAVLHAHGIRLPYGS